jgi:5-methylcytosine-specific restriction endonuclease McrA
MNWDNYAEEWEYDHIKPLAAFDFSNEDEVKEAFNYKNVRPLNKKQNQLKGSTWNGKKQYYNEN